MPAPTPKSDQHFRDTGIFAWLREWLFGTLCYCCGKRFRTDDIGRQLCYTCGFDKMVERRLEIEEFNKRKNDIDIYLEKVRQHFERSNAGPV